jgi:lantibiotic modifying enzyme
VAHGVPGVLPVLAQACAAGVDARELLDGAVAWTLAQKLPGEEESDFPYTVAEGSDRKPTRLAWCYGDLGIAVTLLSAARTMGEESWEREAVEIGRKAARRRLEGSGVIDAGLCHGAAGDGHLFNRLYQATGDPVFREAAVYWIEQALAMQKPGEGIGGYQVWVVGEGTELAWRPDPGFLTGSAGIALALLAAATEVEPEWDRVLLADIPGKKS